MFCGIDAHKRFHVAALVDQGGQACGSLSFANSPEGTARVRAFLAHHDAADAPIGVEGAGHFARAMCAEPRRSDTGCWTCRHGGPAATGAPPGPARPTRPTRC